MKMRIRAVSGYVPPLKQLVETVDYVSYIEISDLTELWELRRDIGSRLIVDVDHNGEPELVIYDDYLE